MLRDSTLRPHRWRPSAARTASVDPSPPLLSFASSTDLPTEQPTDPPTHRPGREDSFAAARPLRRPLSLSLPADRSAHPLTAPPSDRPID